MKNCNNCANLTDCGTAKKRRFKTVAEWKKFLKSESDSCKDWKLASDEEKFNNLTAILG